MKLLHSGGWKKLISEKVEKEVFSEAAAQAFNTSVANVIDFLWRYGRTGGSSLLGLSVWTCRICTEKISKIILRNCPDFKRRQSFMNARVLKMVMSILGTSYPSQGILTEDIVGISRSMDDCPCGRKGKYFRFNPE